MTTPTDDEISYCYPGNTNMRYVRFASIDAPKWAVDIQPHYREGLPVKDEARELWDSISSYGGTPDNIDFYDNAIATIRTFLAERDAKRDADVDELVTAVKEVIDDTPAVWANMRLVPALAKLERKP
jgi:hypothetical protein